MKTSATLRNRIRPQLELLESRVNPDYSLSAILSNGNLSINDILDTYNNLSLSVSGSDLVISDASQQFTSAPAGGTLSNGDQTLSIPLSLLTGSIAFNTGGGNDTFSIQALPEIAGSLTIGSLSNPAGGVAFNGALNLGARVS